MCKLICDECQCKLIKGHYQTIIGYENYYGFPTRPFERYTYRGWGRQSVRKEYGICDKCICEFSGTANE